MLQLVYSIYSTYIFGELHGGDAVSQQTATPVVALVHHHVMTRLPTQTRHHQPGNTDEPIMNPLRNYHTKALHCSDEHDRFISLAAVDSYLVELGGGGEAGGPAAHHRHSLAGATLGRLRRDPASLEPVVDD